MCFEVAWRYFTKSHYNCKFYSHWGRRNIQKDKKNQNTNHFPIKLPWMKKGFECFIINHDMICAAHCPTLIKRTHLYISRLAISSCTINNAQPVAVSYSYYSAWRDFSRRPHIARSRFMFIIYLVHVRWSIKCWSQGIQILGRENKCAKTLFMTEFWHKLPVDAATLVQEENISKEWRHCCLNNHSTSHQRNKLWQHSPIMITNFFFWNRIHLFKLNIHIFLF